MIRNVLSRLFAPEPARLPAPEARMALAALLIRVARSDGIYEAAEIDRIERVLAARYALSPFETVALRQEAEMLEAGAPDTVRFTRALKDAVPYEDRSAILTALWSVALADGARGADEDAVLRLVANLLGVTDKDSALARQKAERDLR